MFADDEIALACACLQSNRIQYANVTSPGSNQARLFEIAGDQGHAHTTDTYHCCQELLGEGKIVGLEQVSTLEKPSANPLVSGVNGVASRNSTNLRAEGLFVPPQAFGQRLAQLRAVLEVSPVDPVGDAGDVSRDQGWRSWVSE